MSLSKFELVTAETPQLRDTLKTLISTIEGIPPKGVLFPAEIERDFGLDRVGVLAAMGMLIELGLGRPMLRVTNEEGYEVGRFASKASLPDEIEDDFGRKVEVRRENVELVFDPAVR